MEVRRLGCSFFFSSRRRHTRFDCDWSSDVCSSDLSRSGLEPAYADCARVLHMGLPTAMRKRVPIEVVIEAVRAMRREADRWIAVVEEIGRASCRERV